MAVTKITNTGVTGLTISSTGRVAMGNTTEIDMWFLVAVMMTVYDGGKKDIFIWHTPSFESSQTCLDFVENNQAEVYGHLVKQFPNDKLEKLFCVPEDKLRKFLNHYKQEKEGKSL